MTQVATGEKKDPVSCEGSSKQQERRRIHTVRKKDLILRSIERRPQMQFCMACKFPLWWFRRYSVKHSKMRNFTFDALRPRKTKEHRLGANQHPLDMQPSTLPLRHTCIRIERIFTYIYIFFAKFHCLRNIPRQCIQNARKWVTSYAA